jgi:diguanylate cyclase (GGDEF)-like protein/hemerythrin-like metal-binding protein
MIKDYGWLAEPAARGVFMRLPVPLALISSTGEVFLENEQFARHFDASRIDLAHLRGLDATEDEPWHLTRMPGRDGGVVDAWAQSFEVHGCRVLVLDELRSARWAPELKQLHARLSMLEKLSATDHLTGAWNRAHFDCVIESELGRSVRFRQPLSLVLLDIDHFKSINDTFGHPAGDAVLRDFVRFLKQRVRSVDMIFRWGGEEFAILAVSTGYRNAGPFAEVLRRKIAAHVFPDVGALSVSIGVAEHLGAESPDAWFRRADQALYTAKHSGRDRVVVDPRGSSDQWAAGSGVSALHLVWQEAYQCGNATIDGEHRQLFELANLLIDASFVQGKTPDVFLSALDDLLEHVTSHFADEEALLEQHQYERLASHKAAHAHLLEKALALKDAAHAGTASLGDLISFIAGDVVAHHLFTMDRDFFPLFEVKQDASGAATRKP